MAKAYTVHQLATLSGVSVRSLHYYDEIGLLYPAFVGSNGYRYYEKKQLLRLQQILFYRELGLKLNRIQKILDEPGFNLIAALESHQEKLTKETKRQQKLIQTIAKTIEHLKENQSMNNEVLFQGFDPEKQAEHEQYLIERCGQQMQSSIDESKQKTKGWSQEKWKMVMGEFDEICEKMICVINTGLPPENPKAQELVRRHYEWICQFWTPNRESYLGHSQLILDSKLRSAYTAHHPDLPEYIVEAIAHFSESELT